MDQQSLSIVLPAYNEAQNITEVITRLSEAWPDAEIIVVDDCSVDGTGDCAESAGAVVYRHKYNMGNGAAIKTGARKAKGDVTVFMDADGQHNPEEIGSLLSKINEGFDLVIGARDSSGQASQGRLLGNRVLNLFSSLLTGHQILDLTSGFRAVRTSLFRQFLYLLPNGFSYPTTSTMAFLRSGLTVGFVPISVKQRKGKSKINFLRDGVRFLVIMMKITTLFSPMRVFFPLSVFFFMLGLIRYLYFYMETGGFSNMAGLMFSTSVLVFLIGLVSEQITAMHYGISHAECEKKYAPEKPPK
ncbi:MAG: glycosyltransferase family 2 protein [bacterium]